MIDLPKYGDVVDFGMISETVSDGTTRVTVDDLIVRITGRVIRAGDDHFVVKREDGRTIYVPASAFYEADSEGRVHDVKSGIHAVRDGGYL